MIRLGMPPALANNFLPFPIGSSYTQLTLNACLSVFVSKLLNRGARNVERAGDNLVLRPQNQDYPVDLLPIEEGKTYADLIVGRVCHVAIET